MRTSVNVVFKVLAALGLGSFASLAAAGSPGAIITYGPVGSAVPTISGGMLIALAVLLMLVAFRLLKDRPASGTNLVIAITAITALATGAGGIKLVADAHAVSPVLEMTDPAGNTPLYVPQGGPWQVFNITNVPLQIKQIQYSPGCSDQPPLNGALPQAFNGGSVGTCSTSTTLAPKSAEYCEITVYCNTLNGGAGV
jgi:hypothetical protein